MIDISRIREMLDFKKVEPVQLELSLKSTIKAFEIGTRRLWSYQEGYTEEFYIDPDGQPIKEIWFRLYPIETISMIEWYFGETEADGVTIETGNYNIVKDKGKVIRSSTFYCPFVKATITGGYTNAQIWTLFPDIVAAIIAEMKYSSKRENDINIIVNSQGFEGGSTSLKHDTFHPKFISAIKRYRRLT
jgi:hypothetical protein